MLYSRCREAVEETKAGEAGFHSFPFYWGLLLRVS